MGLFSKDIHSLEDLYQHGLRDIYYAENQIVKSLPKMIENASDGELKRGLQQHLRETQEQVRRLQQVFKLHDQDPTNAPRSTASSRKAMTSWATSTTRRRLQRA
jgi:ferritin-like metal-binding protein YciE